MTTIRLDEYSTTPLYNIKAVVQSTNISPSTLRAWERRYNMCQPQRSESGYRLYSDRDVAIIRWLKMQVDAGMAISQAVTWLQNLIDLAPTASQAPVLPEPMGGLESARPQRSLELANVSVLQQRLLHALLAYQEDGAEAVLAHAFALYSIEQVGEEVIMPVLVEIGDRWHRGLLSVTREHYATNYLIQRLAALLRTVPNATNTPLIWVGCAPGEQHEIGAMLLSIYLRRVGYTVKPELLLFSATTVEAANKLQSLCEMLANLDPPRPMIGYGGRAFNLRPELRDEIAGVYLGATAVEAVESIGDLLADFPFRRVVRAG